MTLYCIAHIDKTLLILSHVFQFRAGVLKLLTHFVTQMNLQKYFSINYRSCHNLLSLADKFIFRIFENLADKLGVLHSDIMTLLIPSIVNQ